MPPSPPPYTLVYAKTPPKSYLYSVFRLRQLPIGVRLTRKLHELMSRVRGHHAAPVRFRTIQNGIGKPGSTIATATYIPPLPERWSHVFETWRSPLTNRTFSRWSSPLWLIISLKPFTQFWTVTGRVRASTIIRNRNGCIWSYAIDVAVHTRAKARTFLLLARSMPRTESRTLSFAWSLIC